MSDEERRQDRDTRDRVFEMNGKLDSLIYSFDRHMQETREFREAITHTMSGLEKDINQAKGAKAAIVTMSGVLAAAISTAVAALNKLGGG